MRLFLIIIVLNIFIFSIIDCYILTCMSRKTVDINQYKISNFYLTTTIAISYISGVICLLYALRVYNINREVDLKEFYMVLIDFLTLFIQLPFSFLFYFTLFCILIMFFLFLTFIIILKFCNHHIFMLYIYYYHFYYRQLAKKNIFPSAPFENVIYFFQKLGYQDIFSYYLYSSSNFFMKLFYGQKFNICKLSKYHPHSILAYYVCNYKQSYAFIIIISPIFVVLYDCIYNDYVITHVFYYLLFYGPIILLKRISTCVFTSSLYICQTLWVIYYSNEKSLYAIHAKLKPVLDSYLLSGLQHNIKLDIDIPLYIFQTFWFMPYNNESDIFINNEGITIKLMKDNSIVEEKEDEDGNIMLGKEWVFLEYQKGYINNKDPFRLTHLFYGYDIPY